jgi:hypothetical protein
MRLGSHRSSRITILVPLPSRKGVRLFASLQSTSSQQTSTY